MSKVYIPGIALVSIGLLTNFLTSPQPFVSLFYGEFHGTVFFWGGLGAIFGVLISKQK